MSSVKLSQKGTPKFNAPFKTQVTPKSSDLNLTTRPSVATPSGEPRNKRFILNRPEPITPSPSRAGLGSRKGAYTWMGLQSQTSEVCHSQQPALEAEELAAYSPEVPTSSTVDVYEFPVSPKVRTYTSTQTFQKRSAVQRVICIILLFNDDLLR